jgi:hypothetical protein
MPRPHGAERAPRATFRAVSLVVLALSAAFAAHSAALAATPRVHAIVGARIVTAPGQVIPRGTIVIRDGVIEAVGASVAVPADARVWDAESLTVYPGMIDALRAAARARDRPGGSVRPRRPSPRVARRARSHR